MFCKDYPITKNENLSNIQTLAFLPNERFNICRLLHPIGIRCGTLRLPAPLKDKEQG